MLTLAQAASELGVSAYSLRWWLRRNPADESGMPYYVPIGRHRRFETLDIERLRDGLARTENVELKPRKESVVYFVAVRCFIKIGWTVDWRRRLAELQVGNPETLEVLLILGRPKVYERTMHAKFSAHRSSGEWFRDHPDIRAHIDQHREECWYRAGRFK